VKLKIDVSPAKLSLGVLSKRLRVVLSGVSLSVVVLSKKLTVELGRFVLLLTKSDAFSAAEDSIARVRKAIANITGTTDVRVMEFRKVRNNAAAFSDGEQYFAEDYVEGAPLAQTYTDPIQISRRVGKVLANSSAVTDVSVLGFNKAFNHGVGVTDDVNGVLPGDDQTAAFFKSLDQTFNAAELLDRRVAYKRSFTDDPAAASAYAAFLAKVTQDAAAAATDGSLRMQSYTEDMTYFAEDYVGISQTF
jgi:hypothetical protein